MSKFPRFLGCFLTLAAAASCSPQSKAIDFNDVAARHPAGATLRQLFPANPPALPDDFRPTGLTKKDYLRLIAGNVDFWKNHLSADGAIIDPYEKDEKTGKNLEKQYSTPAFALAAAELVKEAGREDLLEPAVRSFSFALTALVKQTTANQHADFYIPMLIHARRILAPRVPPATAAKWETQFKSLVPEIHYRDKTAGGNWSLVHVSGEAMRRRDKLVATTQATTQRDYVDKMLKKQQRRFTRFGMYEDPGAPLAYDAFPRLWMEDMLADGAFDDGAERPAVENFLTLGSFSSLLLMSPSGEWPCGGRSAHHQWNEAENAVIGEINAARWKQRGRYDIAAAFKRMAHMGLKSMLRWQRPSGEMWIVKNFAPPPTRFGFEGYSFNSQYNLLPMAMLAIAYERADETIAERPIPSEYGSYVLDLRDPFTKVVAACGGYYVEIDTCADAHYNATGLQRVHRRGVDLSPLSDSAAPERVIGAAKDDPKIALAPGIQWKDGNDWIGLADFHRYESPAKPATTKSATKLAPATQPATKPKPQRVMRQATLIVEDPAPDRIGFTFEYDLTGPGARTVSEHYVITSAGVTCDQSVVPEGDPPRRFVFPILVNDGAKDTTVTIENPQIHVTRTGGKLSLVSQNPTLDFVLSGPRIATHNGYVRAATAELSEGNVRWQVRLEPAPLK